MKLAVIGATGLVGQELLHVLEEREFPSSQLYLTASAESSNIALQYGKDICKVLSAKETINVKPDAVILATDSSVSKTWAPAFSNIGATVIDHSTVWRMDDDHKLIIPEINGHLLTAEDKIIASPNCTTTQLVMAIHPLYQQYGIERLVISTYQSVTGAGKKGVDQLLAERQGSLSMAEVFPEGIDFNVFPRVGIVQHNKHTDEEEKVVRETHKILADSSIGITVTAVRVPTLGGHAMSVNIALAKDFELEEVVALLATAPGVQVTQGDTPNTFANPIQVRHKDEVFISRIRVDESQPRTLNMWVVADNLRKGAATNSVQIFEYLQKNGLLPKGQA